MKKRVLLAAVAWLAASSPQVTAQQAGFDLKEWAVEWGGRTRDPAVAPDGRVWFVGQTGNYIAVFDPKEFEDRADYGRPNELARGMRWVLVNGRPVIENGRFDATRRAGTLLLRPK